MCNFKQYKATFDCPSSHAVQAALQLAAYCKSIVMNDTLVLHSAHTQSKVRDLGVCWNDCFRKIFKYNRWESVSELQQCCGELSFQCIYDKSRMNFLNSANALKIVWFFQQLTCM